MREDEVLIQVDRFLVVPGCICEFAQDEMELSSMIVDVRVLFLLLRCLLEVIRSSVSLSYCSQYVVIRFVSLSALELTELEMHACPLDVALGQRRLELHTPCKILEGIFVLAS